MRKIHAALLVATLSGLTATAQSKFDARAAQYLDNANENQIARLMHSRGETVSTIAPEVNPEYPVSVMVTFRDASDASVLSEKGYDVTAVLGRVVVANLTPAEMQEVASLDEVLQVSFGQENKLMLDEARSATGVNTVHDGGDGLEHGYKGAGVVVGMMDSGLDVGHLNFRTDDGETRFKRLYVFYGTREDELGNIEPGTERKYETKSAIDTYIKDYGTDKSSGTHGTHVLGIIAGSYDKAPGTNNGGVAIVRRGNAVQMSSTKVPFYGVAPEADLAACCGELYDPIIITSAVRVRDYAKSEGRPGVFNLSLGNNIGPHDGTDATCLALAEAGKDMLITISAGNEGGEALWLNKNFTSSDNKVQSLFGNYNNSGLLDHSATVSGVIDVWGDNASPLTVKLVAVDASGNIAYTYTFNPSTGMQYVGGTGLNYSNVAKDAEFSKYFGTKGFIGWRTNVDSNNNRYNVYITSRLDGGSANGYMAGLIIEGGSNPGVNAYGRNIGFYNANLSGYQAGSVENTINGMACGDNVLVVGSYVNKDEFPVALPDGLADLIHFVPRVTKGSLSAFSSHGRTFAGRLLPDVVGPGQGMISSYSRYYMAANSKDEYNIDGSAISAWVYNESSKKTKSYWAEMSGTSMSSPFVAGVLALWAEAAAERGEVLTMDRVKQIIKETADNDEFTAQQPERWGMGKINALAGLKKILSQGSVNSIGADDPEKSLIVENRGGKQFNVFMGGTDGFTANLYNMQGALVASVATEGDNIDLDASAMGDGIYLLEVQARNTRVARKLMVK